MHAIAIVSSLERYSFERLRNENYGNDNINEIYPA